MSGIDLGAMVFEMRYLFDPVSQEENVKTKHTGTVRKTKLLRYIKEKQLLNEDYRTVTILVQYIASL